MHDIKLQKNLISIVIPYKESTPKSTSGREYTIEKTLQQIRNEVRQYFGTTDSRIPKEWRFIHGEPNEYTIRRFDWVNSDKIMNKLYLQ